MRQGNTNTIVGTQNVGDSNLTGNIGYINNGSIRFKEGLGGAASQLEINQGVIFRNAFKSSNVISLINSFFGGLDSVFNNFSFGCDSILYWVVKKKHSYIELTQYGSTASFAGNSLIPNLFSDISSFVTGAWDEAISNLGPVSDIVSSFGGGGGGGQVNLNSFYDTTSDSIGVMANSKYLQLDTTLPVFDISQDTYGVPIPFAASSENKISPNTRNIMYDLSKFNTALMRRNLVGVAYGNTTLRLNMAADATVPHGVNLINDLPTFTKINSQLSSLVSTMAGVIPGFKLFQYVCYLSNIGNKTGFNLRDDRPVQSSDKDFVVITSEQRSQNAINQINEIAALSEARARIQRLAQSVVLSDVFRTRGSVVLPNGTVVNGDILGEDVEVISEFEVDNIPADLPQEARDELQAIADRYGVSVSAIAAMINTESGWNTTTRLGSYFGLTQIGRLTFNEAGGTLAGYTWDQFVNGDSTVQIKVYGAWLEQYNLTGKLAQYGINLSSYSPSMQAAFLQGFQFAPNGTSWISAFANGNFNVQTTTTTQARVLGTTTITDMANYYSESLQNYSSTNRTINTDGISDWFRTDTPTIRDYDDDSYLPPLGGGGASSSTINTPSQTVVLTIGNNDYGYIQGSGNSGKFTYGWSYNNTVAAINRLQEQGYEVVVIPPDVNSSNSVIRSVAQSVYNAAVQTGATVEYGTYGGDRIHLTTSSIQSIKNKYPGALYSGDSNSTLLNSSTLYGRIGANSEQISQSVVTRLPNASQSSGSADYSSSPNNTPTSDDVDIPDLTEEQMADLASEATGGTSDTPSSGTSSGSSSSNTGSTVTTTPETDTGEEESTSGSSPANYFSQVSQALAGFSSNAYSNKQTSQAYTFFVDVGGVLQEVDYLMKSVVRSGMRACKTINQRLSVADSVERATGSSASELSNNSAQILGLPADSPYIKVGSQLIQGMLTNQNINNILFESGNNVINGIIGSAQSNPTLSLIQGYYDGAAGSLNQLGSLFGESGGLIPSTGELINALNPVSFLQDLNVPPLLPSLNLGSIGDLLGFAANIGSNGPPTSISGLLELQEQLYTIVCNFQLPDILDQLDTWYTQWETFVNNFEYKEIDDKLVAFLTVFVDRILDRFNIIKLIKNAIKSGTNLWETIKKEFWERFFSCERYKQQDKSGVSNQGGQGGPPGII